MRIESITDPLDDRLAGYRDLTDVALRVKFEPESGVFIAESASVIERAVAAGHRPYSVLMEDKWLDRMSPVLAGFDELPVYVGDRQTLEAITGFHVHRGALALMHRPTQPSVEQVIDGASRILILEDIVDHTNVGAIVRCAAGLGFDGFLVSPRCADPLYRRSVRVSMGTVFDLPWARIVEWPAGIDELKKAGFTVVAITPAESSLPLDEFETPDKVALIVGTEGDGLTTAAVEQSDVAVRIPMQHGVDSLNVAAAAAVVCWHMRPSGASGPTGEDSFG